MYLFARRGNSFASRTMIVKDPIWKINGKANEVECSFGASTQFHVPHGLYMAPDGALWATDTSLHIAVKFSAQELQKCSDSESEVITSIEIGIRGVHGSDQHHLSAPTDVVVARHNGNVYVSDGYGNKRVAVFSSLGEYLFEFGTNVGFDIVHNVALDEDAERAFVADRNNGRLHYFSMLDGTYIGTIDPGIKGRPGYFGHMSSVAFYKNYLITLEGVEVVVRRKFHGVPEYQVITTFGNKDMFKWPHDLEIVPGSMDIVVAELDGERALRFQMITA